MSDLQKFLTAVNNGQWRVFKHEKTDKGIVVHYESLINNMVFSHLPDNQNKILPIGTKGILNLTFSTLGPT